MNQPLKFTLLSSLLLGGCAAVGPEYNGSPDLPVKENASFPHAVDNGKGAIYQHQESIDAWWQQLQDETLNKLITKAIVNNTDLRVALANVMAARSLLTESEVALQPGITTSGSIEASRRSSVVAGSPDQALDDNIITSASIGLNWELDVFGRIKRSIEAAEANINYTAALHDDVKRIVIADVTRAYIDLRGAQVRREVIDRNIKNQLSTLELTILMYEEGMVSELDAVRARAQLRTTEALLPTLISNEVSAENRLALLCGAAPQQLDIDLGKTTGLPSLPAFLPVGDAGMLIRRRPDIRAAESMLAGLTARVGIETADLFPTVSFGAGFGLSADQPNNLGESGALNYSIGPGINWNLFNREAIRARIRQAQANVDAQLARYDGVVLKALSEVDTALIRHIKERDRSAALQESTIASREAVELVRIRYNAGVESFLAVLDAERTQLNAEQQSAFSEIELAQSLIRVYRALGGGWEDADQ